MIVPLFVSTCWLSRSGKEIRVNIRRGRAVRTWFLAPCLVYSDAINASEKVSNVRFTRRAAVKNDCGTWPNLPLTFKEPIIWRKLANRSVRVGEWERLKECCRERVWKKQKQTCNQKKKIKTDTWHLKPNWSHTATPAGNYQTKSTMTSSVSFDRFCRQQAERHTLSAWHKKKKKSLTHFKGKWQGRPCDALYALEVESNQWVAE